MLNFRFSPRTVTCSGEDFVARLPMLAADEALVGSLVGEADKYLQKPLPAVTLRRMRAPSGDPHDYCSYGPYWWPDPNKPDGLPFIRRDGEVNPDTKDDNSFGRLFSTVRVLTLAALFTENTAYADRAVEALRVWYIDPATRMNPHMQYAQAIPGICDGRGIGMIDCSGSYMLLDAVAVLDALRLLPAQVDAALREWYGRFLDWSLTSENGADEDRQHNNHGTWYDVQAAATARFLNRPMLAKRTLTFAYERRVLKHILPDGRQPHELARTNALGYSSMNLRALILLGKMAALSGIKQDYFHDVLPGEQTPRIRAAVEYLAPYAEDVSDFPYQNIHGTAIPDDVAQLMHLVAPMYPDADYEARAAKYYKPNHYFRCFP